MPQPYGQGTLYRFYTSAGWTSPFVSQAPTGIYKSTFIYLRPSSDPSLTQCAGYLKTLLLKTLMYCCYYYYFNMAEKKKTQGRQYTIAFGNQSSGGFVTIQNFWWFLTSNFLPASESLPLTKYCQASN